MNLIEFAIENERWDLAAHAIVLVAVRAVTGSPEEEVNGNGRTGKERKEKGGSKRQ
jgi:hypothetical protein